MNLHIAYSADDNYARHAGISILSLFENNLKVDSITVYIMENNISELNKQKLLYIAKTYNRNIKFIKFDDIEKYIGITIWADRSLSAMTRLFLDKVIPNNVDKLIYLDCDTIINGSLESLWNIDMDSYCVAGVLDTTSNVSKTLVGLNKDDVYINSGVLLMNIKRWRKNSIDNKILKFIESYQGKIFHMDQGVINGALKNEILVIHPKYNVLTSYFSFSHREIVYLNDLNFYYSEKEIIEAKENPIIIHYTPDHFNRPWIENCIHPLRKKYIDYKEISPWNEILLEYDKRKWYINFLIFIKNNFGIKIYKVVMTIIGIYKKKQFS